MIPYIIFFIIPIIFFLHPLKGSSGVKLVAWSAMIILGTLFIGLRFKVGGDWSQYLYYLYQTRNVDFLTAIQVADPGYMAINWVSNQLGLGIIGVNLFCGFCFTLGLTMFSLKQPYPWLAFLIAVPYLFIVVGMGYSRQAVALAFVMMAFSFWGDGKLSKYLAFVFIGALFHKAAVVMLPFSILLFKRISIYTWLIAFPTIGGVGLVLLYDSISVYAEVYASGMLSSSGGLIRVILNLVPISIAIFHLEKLKLAFPQDFKLWASMSLVAIACLPLVLIASTAIDRIALFIAPLQIALSTRIVFVQKEGFYRAFFALFFVILYASVLFVWLNYADNSYSWIPYQAYLGDLDFNKI
jgi:hypothetical protein